MVEGGGSGVLELFSSISSMYEIRKLGYWDCVITDPVPFPS